MKVRDLIPMNIDIDVCDDYDESCYLAYCGPYRLTEEAEKKFSRALDLQIDIREDIVIISCGDDEKNVKAAAKFFYAIAGYCDAEDFDRWFVEVDEDVQD